MTYDRVCPLCGSAGSDLKKTIDVEEIVRGWMQQFGCDVRGEFHGASHFELYRCRACSLRFFKPDCVAGSPAIYESLSKVDWYYIPHKWEHDAALDDFGDCVNGIEIGCGVGSFVARVIEEKKIAFEGCEQNAAAVQVARAKNLPVRLATAESLAKSHPGSFAAVCSFQVMEHLIDPRGFLAACAALLRRGGKLMIGVPNAESFLKYEYQLLDMPPHHMTRWNDSVLRNIEKLCPLRLVRIAHEPLADYHANTFVDVYSDKLSELGLVLFRNRRLRSWLVRMIRESGIQPLLRGHTIYACYVRI